MMRKGLSLATRVLPAFVITMSGWRNRAQADGFIPLEGLLPRLSVEVER